MATYARCVYIHRTGSNFVRVCREPEGYSFEWGGEDHGFYPSIDEATREIDHLSGRRSRALIHGYVNRQSASALA